VWGPVTGKLVGVFPPIGFPLDVFAHTPDGAFSPDGTRLAVWVVDNGVRIRSRKAKDDGKPEEPRSPPVPPRVFVYDVGSGKVLRLADGSSIRMGSLGFAPDGNSLGFGSNGEAAAFDPAADAPARTFRGATGDVRAVAID